MVNRRPRLELRGSSATSEEAAAVMAAVEQFLRDTAPPPAPPEPRQADVQMVRVKLPFGGITPDQMETFADVVERWVPLEKGHITTRQNIQMHHVPLRDAAALIRELSDAGLSSREGCGNTVRNVTADPW